MDFPLTRDWISRAGSSLADGADYLTQLDSAIGDADHGVNISRGFAALDDVLAQLEPATPGELLVEFGTTLVTRVGGASGPLYGTAFRAIGNELRSSTVDATVFGHALRVGLEALQRLGAAMPGDKTIVDAYQPAVDAFDVATGRDAGLAVATRAAADAAHAGMLATIPLLARKGRASYLGPRSVGHQDPGATSMWLILRSLAEVANGSPAASAFTRTAALAAGTRRTEVEIGGPAGGGATDA